MKASGDKHAATAFLDALFDYCKERDGFLHLRFLPSKESLFIRFSEIARLSAILSKRENQNAYFGIGTRTKDDGTKAGVIEVAALWIDMDLEKLSAEERRAAAERLKALPFEPSFIIATGGGLHVYWRLREPIGKAEIPRLEGILKRLAAYLGGDPAATDASRILRLPGTFNHKREPVAVQVIEQNGQRYEASDFEEFLIEDQPVREEPPPLRLMVTPDRPDNKRPVPVVTRPEIE